MTESPTQRLRLIVCVDGGKTLRTPFGHANTTNITKIVSVVKEGIVTDPNGSSIEQVVIYTEAVDDDVGPLATLKNRNIEDQIEFITKRLCQMLKSPQDELFLYGSGHGAYIVRAIAGVFHHMGLPKSWSLVRFHENYLIALDLCKARREGDIAKESKLIKNLKAFCDEPPRIKFVGAFDTIQPDSSSHDLTFNSSIQMLRHALALNEGVSDLLDIPGADGPQMGTCVQAWFMGNNDDMCGGGQHDGLSLYPLQWMLLESVKAGLLMGVPANQVSDENPLLLGFPHCLGDVPTKDDIDRYGWQTKYKNGLTISMFDLQPTHAMTRPKSGGTHTVHLKGESSFYFHPRKVFGSEGLIGWSQTGALSTILHPSVYCLLDRYPKLRENQRFKSFRKDLVDFQEQCMYNIDGVLPPWLEGMQLQANGVKAFRILVCGKTGVGKSTLINKVFGVEMTEESDSYAQGVHDINQAFESPSHPGLLVHDSRGWQAGSNEELDLIAQFLRRRAFQKDPAEALHVIWFCVDSDVSRIEEVDRKTFEIITQYSHHVPVFIIGTKKDKVAKFRKMQLLEDYLESETITDMRRANQVATQETEKHVKRQFSELVSHFSKIRHYRADVALCLSKGDDAGIRDLLNQTLGLIADERVRLFCVAAQIVSVDQKIRSAISETMRLGAHAIRTAMLPLPCSGIIATPTVSRLLCEQILQCFGFPKATPEVVDEIMSRVVMENLKQYMAVAMTQFIIVTGATVGVAVATLGIGTVMGISGCIFSAPPAARMLLKCACDMILILERAFRYGGKFVSAKQIEDAAKYYTRTMVKDDDGEDQLLQQRVHKQVERLVPLTSIKTAWRFSRLRLKLEEIIYHNRFDQSPTNERAELGDSTGQSEMPAGLPPVEIGDRASIVELEGDLARLPYLLSGSASLERRSASPATRSTDSSRGISTSVSTPDNLSDLPVHQPAQPSQTNRNELNSLSSKWRRTSVGKLSSTISARKVRSTK